MRTRTASKLLQRGLGVVTLSLVGALAAGTVGVLPAAADDDKPTPLPSVTFGPPATGSHGAYAVTVAYPTPLTMPAVSDGNPSDVFTFSLSANTAGCQIASNGSGFSYQQPGSCVITASTYSDPDHDGAPGDDDGGVVSATLTVTVTRGAQSITLASSAAPANQSITLSASGYSGTGQVTYQVTGGTASGCTISTDQLSASSAGTCLVTATIAADSLYDTAVSTPATETFTILSQSITLASSAAPANQSITLSASGYSGTGQVTYQVTGGTASGCTISTDQLSASSAGTCLVTATIAADSLYDTAVSTPATETFTPLGTLIVTAEGGVVSAGSTFHPTSNVSGTVGSDSASVTSVSYTYVGTGSTTYGPSTVAPTAPGTYEVTPSAAVIAVSPVADLGDYNATYTYVGASLTILAPPVVVAAVSTTVDQGQPTGVPIALGGLVNGDSGTITSVTVTYTGTGSTVYGPSTVPPTLPGTYEVTPSAATVSISPPQDAGLYPGTVTYRSATLTIVAVGHLTVAVADLSATAGDTITPSVSVHGLLGSDIASLGAVTVTYVGEGGTVYGPSTTAPSAAGTYLMTPSSATVTITPAADQVQYLQPYAYVAGTLVLAPAPVIVPVKPVVVPKTTHVVIKTFAEGSATLSPSLKRQVLALARRVKSGHYLRVELAGYTDNVFTPAFDALLVYQRAQAVATQLRADLAALKAGGVTIVIVPGVTVELVSANSTAAGRAANRKVIATLKAH